MDETNRQLEARLAEVEREVASLKKLQRGAAMRGALAWGACGLAVAAALFAGARPGITQEEGTAVKAPFRVVTPDGKPVATINSDNEGPFIRLFNAAGGNLRVLDKEGRNAVSLFARSDGSGGNVAVYNDSGKSVFAAFARSDNRGGDVGIYDKDGKEVAALFARNEGGGVLQIYDGDAKVVFKRPE